MVTVPVLIHRLRVLAGEDQLKIRGVFGLEGRDHLCDTREPRVVTMGKAVKGWEGPESSFLGEVNETS